MATWKERALSATRDTQLGAILHAALKLDKPPPHFWGKAFITSDGFVMAGFVDRTGNNHMGAFVGSVEDLESNTVGLAKHLGLNKTDKKELFDAVRGWISTDWRSRPGLNLPV